MKLDRCRGLVAVAFALFAIGCGAYTPKTATKPPVGTAKLMVAELTEGDGAPRVGKPQHSRDEIVDDDAVKDAPARRAERRGAGFSGYK